jgi:hypothetical protein
LSGKYNQHHAQFDQLMNLLGLLSLLDALQQKGILNQEANGQIRQYLTFKNTSLGKLFLTLAAINGALFAAAGVLSIISYNRHILSANRLVYPSQNGSQLRV